MAAFEGGLSFYGPFCRKRDNVLLAASRVCGNVKPNHDGESKMEAGWCGRRDGTGEEVGERMPSQSAPCRETHAAVSIRVLVMTSEDQREEQADSQGNNRREQPGHIKRLESETFELISIMFLIPLLLY